MESNGPSRHLVLVAGVGRSGTSLFASILSKAGFHVPQPEVGADPTNPKGFGEPKWAVDFHMRQLRARRVLVWDSRPAAWAATAGASDVQATVDELRSWITAQFDGRDLVVVKDPRIAWFIPLWQRAALDLGIAPAFATMLRHPAEAVSSAIKWYGEWQTAASRTTSWLNIMLETEHATRQSPRVFVRYDDLLDDWAGEIQRVGTALDIAQLRDLPAATRAGIDAVVDPSLHRSRVSWADLGVPGQVEQMTEDAWGQFVALTKPGGDTSQTAPSFDAARQGYHRFYAEAEDISQSTVLALREDGGPAAPAGVVGAVVRVTRRVVPRKLRLRVPPEWRARIMRFANRRAAKPVSGGSSGTG